MKKNKKALAVIGVAVILAVALLIAVLKTADGKLDVVGQEAAASFGRILDAAPEQVTADTANAGWSLNAPDGSVRFIWSGDYGKGPLYDVMLELDAGPFLKAGLDTGRLPEHYTVSNGTLAVGARLGNDVPGHDGELTPPEAFGRIVEQNRSVIGYHTALDHFNVSLGGGNLFEWAKDTAANSITKEAQDKDIVFVLNPEPLIAAGVDPEQVEGWVYTTVSVELDGKPTDVYKFLKPFNLQ